MGILTKKLKQSLLLRKILADGYLFDKGFFISMLSRSPRNKNNEPIPWLTYSSMDFLIPRLSKEFTLLEYGAGYSTLFFSKYFKNVTSIEHDNDWIDILKDKISLNCNIISALSNKDDYVLNTSLEGDYDIVLIDGLFRNDCAINAPKILNDIGVIIFDDSNRPDYSEAYTYLKKNNYKRLDFWGLSPGSIRNNCTSIFYLKENCLGI